MSLETIERLCQAVLSQPPVRPAPRSLERSRTLRDRAQALIPSCTQTFSKGPTQFVQGVAPVFLERGRGSHVWDVDGNEYIDYVMGLAPVILGYAYPAVDEAVARQMRDGVILSLPHPLEVEVAQLLVDLIPCAQMVRFAKNGSDATAGAVRVARAFTGREIVACSGYHGWQDWFVGATTRRRGVPDAVARLTKPFAYNDLDGLTRILDAHRNQVACVIMEPVGVVPPRPGFLEGVRALCDRHGALLVFDEIVTGFRFAVGGAQEYFGVTPDLACFGKAMANGYPLAAVVGRRDVMALFDEVFFSFTFGGDTLALTAAKVTIEEIRSQRLLAHVWAQGERLRDAFNVLARELGVDRRVACSGYGPRTLITFKDETGRPSLVMQSFFQQECVKRGILIHAAHNMSYSHTEDDLIQTLRVYRTTLELLATALAKGDLETRLEGPAIQPVFREP